MNQYSQALVITDPVYTPKSGYNRIDRALLRVINDPRDLPFAHFMLESTLVILPIIFCLYFFSAPWYIAALYVPFNVLGYMDRYILTLHNTSHRPLFTKQFQFFNKYLVWVLGPLFGETPETYYAHHVGMHHVEENLPADLSSTMKYRRDSFTQWLRYFLRFFFGVIVELVNYMTSKKRWKLRKRIIAGELTGFVVVALLFYLNPVVTTFVFVLPWLICRLSMMAGNWAQHAFIDPNRPEDPFASSITVINCRYNRRCFNDGYHIGHHLKSTRHWTELPIELNQNREMYKQNNAVLFSGLDYIMIWALLMFKRYDVLAKHFVDLQQPARSQNEIVELLRYRTQPIPA